MIDELAELLRKKSEQINLFSTGDRDKLLTKHFPDALSLFDFWQAPERIEIIDLGTGGGIPALPLAIKLKHAKFTLVDSCEKKLLALKEICVVLKIENVSFVLKRIEEIAHQKKYREKFDFVTARALAELPVLLEYSSGFLRTGGKLFAWKGADFEDELKSSFKAQKEFKLFFKDAFIYNLPSGENRSILVFEKTSTLDNKYPRQNGMPKTKPIL